MIMPLRDASKRELKWGEDTGCAVSQMLAGMFEQ
jgi:hypothetical protein